MYVFKHILPVMPWNDTGFRDNSVNRNLKFKVELQNVWKEILYIALALMLPGSAKAVFPVTYTKLLKADRTVEVLWHYI